MPRVRNTRSSEQLYTPAGLGLVDSEYRPLRLSHPHPYLGHVPHISKDGSLSIPWPTPSPSPPPSVPGDEQFATPTTTNPSLPSLDSIPQSSKHQRKSASRRAYASSSQQTTHIPRPRNAYVLYRSWALMHHPSLTGSTVTNKQDVLSKLTGALWNAETNEVRAHFEMLSREEKERHAMKYPGYSYLPKKGMGAGLAKAGRVNGLKADRYLAGRRKFDEGDEGDGDDDAEFVPSFRTRSSNHKQSVSRSSGSSAHVFPTPEPTPDPMPTLSMTLPADLHFAPTGDAYFAGGSSDVRAAVNQPEQVGETEYPKSTPYLTMFPNVYLPPSTPSMSTASPASSLSELTQSSDFMYPTTYENTSTEPFDFSCLDTSYITPEVISSVLNSLSGEPQPSLIPLANLAYTSNHSYTTTEAPSDVKQFPHYALPSGGETFMGGSGSIDTMFPDLEDCVVRDLMERYLDF